LLTVIKAAALPDVKVIGDAEKTGMAGGPSRKVD
jgi:hypothetical protein